MKIKYLLVVITASLLSFTAYAENGHAHNHDHETKTEAGPNGGKIIQSIDPHAEFFVTSDRKIQITFVDDHGESIAPAEQVVTVITGDRSAPLKMTFSKSGNVLLSDQTLPEGTSWPAVVQIKANSDAKASVEKFTLNLANCSGCNLAEYACTCEHAH